MSSTHTPFRLGLFTVPFVLIACGGAEADYDEALLDQYKAALPTTEDVAAQAPGPNADPNALTLLGDAELAHMSIKSALAINAPAVLVVRLLRTITDLPPTLYDSEKKEFVWGPWDNDDDYGQVLVYLRENPEGDDFKYGYAVIRLVDSDISTGTPVVWGGATPGEKKQGVGVTLWDFEANNAFSTQHDPDFDETEARDYGRFAMVYGRGEEEDGKFGFNVAVFRDFMPKDAEEGAEPVDLDYFYGHFRGNDGNVVDFLDWQLDGNLCDADPSTCFEMAADGAPETLSLRSAFFNHGAGRAEATVSGGDLTQIVDVVECWDDDLDRTHMSVATDAMVVAEEGACQAPFDSTLAELGVPTMAELDQDMLAKMDCVATNGLAACEDE